MLNLAVPSDGSLYKPTLGLLKSCNMELSRLNDRSYTAKIPSVSGVTVHFQRASTITTSVENGSVDMGIVGRDQFLEKTRHGGNSSIVIHNLGYGQSNLVIGVPDFWMDVRSVGDLADVAIEFKSCHEELIRVATKYSRLVEEFLLENGISYFSMVKADGAIEAMPLLGTADIIADISSTGNTMRANRLKTIRGGTIMQSQACVVVNSSQLEISHQRNILAKLVLENIKEGITPQFKIN